MSFVPLQPLPSSSTRVQREYLSPKLLNKRGKQRKNTPDDFYVENAMSNPFQGLTTATPLFSFLSLTWQGANWFSPPPMVHAPSMPARRLQHAWPGASIMQKQ